MLSFAVIPSLTFALLANVGKALRMPHDGLPMPDAPLHPTWSCDYNSEFARGEWGINIVPWWGVFENIDTEEEWFWAYVSIPWVSFALMSIS